MEIIMRRVARAQMKNTYFTGVPCKNGHIAYRYVQSGTCSQCIRSGNAPVDNSERRKVLSSLIQFKARVWDDDLLAVRNIVFATGALRFPDLQVRDLCPNWKPVLREGESAVYRFNVFPQDLDSLKATILQMFNARCYKVTPC